MADLTPEELVALSASPLCIRCNHRGLLHHEDYDSSMSCRVCDCEDFVVEGAFSHWHPSGMFKSIADYTNAYVTQRMIAMIEKDLHLGQGGANDA